MALTAVLAAAVAAVCAAAGAGFPGAIVALLFVPGVALTAANPQRRIAVPAPVRRWAPAVGGVAGLLVYALHPPLQHARYLVLLAVPFSLMWPDPLDVRLALVFSAASFLAAGASLSAVAGPLAGFAVASAVSLVALNRMRGVTGHRLDGRGRRVAADAAVLLAVAGLIALLAASLLPAPQTGNRPSPGRSPSRPNQAAPPYLQPTDRLDAGGAGTGKGNEVVFRVTAPRTALWRTMSFDQYDGRTWRRSPALTLRSRGAQRSLIIASDGDDGPDLTTPRLVQRIEIEAAAVGVLPAAARLFEIELPSGGAAVAADATVAPAPQLGKGATYVATSYPPPSSADELRRHNAGAGAGDPGDDAREAALAAQYLSFAALPERVAQLARDIVAGAGPAEYDRVHAVESWLIANTETAADAPAVGSGADPIDQFLFADRRGSSQQAASAMAVMLRSLRIPARVAVGYVSPRPSAFGGELAVRVRDAHAWVEAWFPQVGWVAFDPAGRFIAPGDETQSLGSRIRRLLGALWWVLVAIVAVIAAWLGSRVLRRRRGRRARPWATQAYERIGRIGEKRGRPRRPSETPAEYCAALVVETEDDRLARVGALVTEAAWSRHEPSPEDRAWADAVVRDLQPVRAKQHAPG